MNCVLKLGFVLMLAFDTRCLSYGGSDGSDDESDGSDGSDGSGGDGGGGGRTTNGKCSASKCQWFNPRCREKSSSHIINNCYEGLFKSRYQINKEIDDIDACRIRPVQGTVLVYGEKWCPYCPFERKYGELRSIDPVTEEEAHRLNRKRFAKPESAVAYGHVRRFASHPCCSTVYSFVVPQQIIIEGVTYNVTTSFGQYQIVYIGQCVVPGASCYQGGVCFEESNYLANILVDNPDTTGPPYIFKTVYYPRYCRCSQ